jgi:hypothetical protein
MAAEARSDAAAIIAGIATIAADVPDYFRQILKLAAVRELSSRDIFAPELKRLGCATIK